MEVIRVGTRIKSPATFFMAISVYPMKAGMAVSTEAIDGGSLGISLI
jgi:hypothetical protein